MQWADKLIWNSMTIGSRCFPRYLLNLLIYNRLNLWEPLHSMTGLYFILVDSDKNQQEIRKPQNIRKNRYKSRKHLVHMMIKRQKIDRKKRMLFIIPNSSNHYNPIHCYWQRSTGLFVSFIFAEIVSQKPMARGDESI